jgi:hypothetical protein
LGELVDVIDPVSGVWAHGKVVESGRVMLLG